MEATAASLSSESDVEGDTPFWPRSNFERVA